jgi:hypothetical protein
MSVSAVAALIVVVALADLWRIGFRPMDPKPRTEQKEIFTQAPYIKALAGDSSTYRVIQLINGQTQYDNTLAYWRVQNAYGYQGAKLRAYQDVVDVAGLGNPLVQQLMNVKYIVMNQPDSAKAAYLAYDGPDMKIYQNPVGAERAFFVNRYETATGLQILNNMAAMSFDPRDVAYVMEDPKITVDPPQAGARVAYVRYGLQNLEASVSATGNNLLFLSEAWYPNGWKAFIDGVETPIHRLNYMFRGVVVPKGEHKLEMRFEPSGFLLGKNLSLAANLLIIGGLGFAGFDWWRKRRVAEQKLKTQG